MDDDLDSDTSGKVFQSGIRPDAKRAPYALPADTPALQDGELEFERFGAVPRALTTRRSFLVLGLGAGFAAAAGVLGSSATNATIHPAEERVPSDAESRTLRRIARKFARGSMQALVDNHATFIWIAEQHGEGDGELEATLGRLAEFALLYRGEQGGGIAKRLVRAYEFKPVPSALRDHFQELGQLVRERKSHE